ncbi:MAG: hypothetical protein R3B70_43965 [Polyangiaceae bacterium]
MVAPTAAELLGAGGEEAASRSAGPQETPPRVRVVANQPWTNYQGNVTEGSVEKQFFFDGGSPEDWRGGVTAAAWVVKQAESDGKSLRSVGSAWSSSPVSQTPMYLLHNGGLSGPGPVIDASDLAPGVDASLISHLQAGTIIQTVNELLEANGQSLKVMGGNAGQNIAGAAATGTHGSWIDRRALADSVHAIALVGAGGRAYWVEPASRPLTREGFSAWGLFEVVRDDALFAAAQVSVGALGVVTSVVLDVDPAKWVDFTRVQRELDAPLRQAIYTLDLSGLGFPKRPDHFEVVLNPYLLGAGQKGAFMETGYIVPPGSSGVARTELPQQKEIAAHFDVSDALWGFVAKLLSEHPWLVPPILDLVLPRVFPSETRLGPMSQVWNLSTGGPPLISTEFAVAQADVERTLDLLFRMLEDAKPGFYWPGVFGIRFGKQTGATLGFTRFDRWCTMELIYLRGVAGVEGFLQRFYAAMRAGGIEVGVHWGQVNFLTAQEVASDYGSAALAAWESARARVGAEGSVFANDATNAWGLTTPRLSRSQT